MVAYSTSYQITCDTISDYITRGGADLQHLDGPAMPEYRLLGDSKDNK